MTHMQLSQPHAPRADAARLDNAGKPPPEVDDELNRPPSAQGFVAMLHGYCSTGGIERETDLAALLDTRQGWTVNSIAGPLQHGSHTAVPT